MPIKVSAGADSTILGLILALKVKKREKSYFEAKKDVTIRNIALARVVGARANF